MTVCISALADNGKAIVCVADKAVTWADNIQWDADSNKIVVLNPSGVAVSTSGAEDSIVRMLRKLESIREVRDIGNYIDECENAYKRCFAEIIQIEFFDQNQITREEYAAAIGKRDINDYMKELAEKIGKYDMECDLLISGFDAVANAFLLQATSPGKVTDMSRTGFEAVGSGADRATPRMLWNDYKRADAIDKVLYDAFDAKANAEMNVGVGYEWDAKILFPGKCEELPKNIKELIEQAWNDLAYSPYEAREPDDLPAPPSNWKELLATYIASITPSR